MHIAQTTSFLGSSAQGMVLARQELEGPGRPNTSNILPMKGTKPPILPLPPANREFSQWQGGDTGATKALSPAWSIEPKERFP